MEDYTTYELEELYEIASQVQQAIELKEALLKQKEYETKDWYATIIRVNPTTQAPLYGQDGWPMPL